MRREWPGGHRWRPGGPADINYSSHLQRCLVKELRSCPGWESSQGFWMLFSSRKSSLFILTLCEGFLDLVGPHFFDFRPGLFDASFFCFFRASSTLILVIRVSKTHTDWSMNSWKVRWSVTAHKHTMRNFKQNLYHTTDNQNTKNAHVQLILWDPKSPKL